MFRCREALVFVRYLLVGFVNVRLSGGCSNMFLAGCKYRVARRVYVYAVIRRVWKLYSRSSAFVLILCYINCFFQIRASTVCIESRFVRFVRYIRMQAMK